MRGLRGAFINGSRGETGEQGKIHLGCMIRYFNCKTRSQSVMLFIGALTSASGAGPLSAILKKG